MYWFVTPDTGAPPVGLLAHERPVVRPDASYPPVLLITSTKDDRVHPGHARKMAALLRAYGKKVLYFENVEGGHGAAADNEQAAALDALAQEFLWRTLSPQP